MNFKWLRVPESNATKEIQVAQLWEVRWLGLRFSTWTDRYPDPRPEVETFLSEGEARTFAASIEAARALLKIKGMASASVEKAK